MKKALTVVGLALASAVVRAQPVNTPEQEAINRRHTERVLRRWRQRFVDALPAAQAQAVASVPVAGPPGPQRWYGEESCLHPTPGPGVIAADVALRHFVPRVLRSVGENEAATVLEHSAPLSSSNDVLRLTEPLEVVHRRLRARRAPTTRDERRVLGRARRAIGVGSDLEVSFICCGRSRISGIAQVLHRAAELAGYAAHVDPEATGLETMDLFREVVRRFWLRDGFCGRPSSSEG